MNKIDPETYKHRTDFRGKLGEGVWVGGDKRTCMPICLTLEHRQ